MSTVDNLVHEARVSEAMTAHYGELLAENVVTDRFPTDYLVERLIVHKVAALEAQAVIDDLRIGWLS